MAKKRVVRKRTGSLTKAAGKSGRKAAKKAPPVKKKAPGASKRAPKKRAAKRPAAKPARGGDLLTLTEVSQRTGISMPTLQRYKKLYQNRLQTVGKGRTQRYKPESLDTFRQIKEENLKKRGRPRKSAAAKRPARRKAGAPGAVQPAELISLSEIGRRTGISYPTLLRYVKLHGSRIPSHGTGRKRRFPEEAVAVFQQLRQESRRGRRKSVASRKPAAGGGMEARLRQLEKSNADLRKQLKKVMKALSKPIVKG